MSGGKKKGSNSKNSAGGGGDGDVVELEPAGIYFTFSRIRPCYSCGRTIQSTIDQFLRHELTPRDLPLLCVFTDGMHYYSQNNRRLYTYKKLQEMGELTTVPVRLRPLPNTRRMAQKYSPEKCSLSATLMGGGSGGPSRGENREESNRNSGPSSEDSESDTDHAEDAASSCESRSRTTVTTPASGLGHGSKSQGLEEEEDPAREGVSGWGDVEAFRKAAARLDAQRERLQQAQKGLRHAEGYRFGRVDSLVSEGNIPRAGDGFTELADPSTLPTTIKGLRLNDDADKAFHDTDDDDVNDADRNGGGRHQGINGKKKKRKGKRGVSPEESPSSTPLPKHHDTMTETMGSDEPLGGSSGHVEQSPAPLSKAQRRKQQQQRLSQPHTRADRETDEEGDAATRNEDVRAPPKMAKQPACAAQGKGKRAKKKGAARRRVPSSSSSSSSSHSTSSTGGRGGATNSLEEELRALGLQ